MKNIGRHIVLWSVVLIQQLAFGQKPREIDLDNEPVDWSDPAKIVVLIVIPVLLVVLGLVWRRKYLKKKGK